ncbi:hypothetical protein LIER_17482 [Lithospermum erythrorhizon]|uniref:Major facilitator superfamily (MFS) profile domain-containing protein n=1 Tax=Lithospermum erythrorhizon TaxID=34254 RepID=A0AAV3QAQ4_LITER
MSGAVLVAIAASVGNLLQGWDNATIAGALLYIKRDFNLETQPTIEGLIVAMSLIGATFITTFSGPLSDSIGRRPMLIMSSLLYFLSGLVMLWAPNVYVLLLARLLDGFGIGLAVTLVPVYISETAPPETRGLLNTFPQFSGCTGMFFSYCMVFAMSLKESPSWRLMLGVLSIPSLIYFALTVFYLPESPRWLVSKGKIKEARQVLQRLLGKEDVSGEMALLCEGLSSGGETTIEEYIIAPESELADGHEHVLEGNHIKLYGAEEGKSWVAKPVRGQSTLAYVSQYGRMINQSSARIDPVVTLFGSIHERLPGTGSMKSMPFPNVSSMFNMGEQQGKYEPWDEEIQKDVSSDASENESDDNLKSPLLSRQATNADGPHANSSFFGAGNNNVGEQLSGIGIGGGWQLAYRKDNKNEGGLKRIYLHQENDRAGSRHGSIVSLPEGDIPVEGEYIHAAVLVSKSVLKLDDISSPNPIEEAVNKPSQAVPKSSIWKELCEPGVKHALIVGVGIQILQQFSGINGVLYYTPQILEQAGVGILLSNLGLGSDSASFLISGLTSLLMLPSIGVAMRLMDIAGRRWLLLSTLPVLLASLVVLVLASVTNMGAIIHAVISTISVTVYFCCFVMGFGPIPNILCSEIFPTRVRGICIAICALTFWFGDIIVTYSLPVILTKVGLGGVFSLYSIVCSVAWVFVYLKVPETKGMPLEVITEFFAMGAKHTARKY